MAIKLMVNYKYTTESADFIKDINNSMPEVNVSGTLTLIYSSNILNICLFRNLGSTYIWNRMYR